MSHVFFYFVGKANFFDLTKNSMAMEKKDNKKSITVQSKNGTKKKL